jgi:deoxyribonuclease V
MTRLIAQLHPWNVSPKEAVEIQRRLASQVRLEPLTRMPRWIAGADLAYFTPETAVAAIVVLDAESLQVVEEAFAICEVHFPYIPGLLSFREVPAVIEAWKRLKIEPDILMLDGQGIAHPRGFGIASHVGVIVDKPTIGCAKSRLVGIYREPNQIAGASSLLLRSGVKRGPKGEEVIGAVVRTRSHVRPVFVSPGHRIDLEGAVRVTLATVKKYRIPEPTRLADQFAARVKGEWAKRAA